MYSDNLQQSAEHARSALDRMSHEGIPANPENFAVWYEYYCGKNIPLIKAVDVLVSDNQSFDGEMNGDLYDKYISPETGRQAVKDVGERIQSQLESMIGLLGEASEGAGQYRDRLQDASVTLGGEGVGLDGLKGVVQSLIADTQKVAEQNSRLDDKLKNSSQQMQNLREELEVAQREAMTDGLTGIPNRKFFDMSLRQAVMDSMESGKALSLLMLDIDFFKKFNDEHGHQIGDEVLKLVARVLQTSIKGRDVAARYGGEEFSIILPDTTLRNAVAVGEHIRKSMASRKIVRRNSGTTFGNITLSIGAAQFEMGESMSSVIERADAALYRAKDGGRNRVMAAEPTEKKIAATG